MTTKNAARVLFIAAGVWAIAATVAEARFLQADPVGYRDDLDLYTYVLNDPLNHNDPTGTTCTITTTNGHQTASCQIDRVMDSSGNVRAATAADHQRYARFERAYTRAENRLLAHADRSVRVVVPAPNGSNVPESARSFTATAGQVAQSLSTRVFEARPSVPGGLDSPGSGYTNVNQGGLAGLPGYGVPNLGYTGNVETAVTHEGLHAPGPDTHMSMYMGQAPWDMLHQVPYNQAAQQLLGLP